MAGRIDDRDLVTLRDRVRIDDIVGEYVTLKSAGGGAWKGLCPFHDERSPSFHVTPARGVYYCFGCGEGGDAITFVQKIEHVTFGEAVERLADRYGVELRFVDGSGPDLVARGLRTRLLSAHAAAETFYREQLLSSAAGPAVAFLKERGFDRAAVEHFGVGFAPKQWDALAKHLVGLGFSPADLETGGLVTVSPKGVFDRFRGRVMWPIRSAGGDTIGFGARKLFDDDDGPKYLNTPETPLYKKSQVLYGLDLARKPIAASKSAIVVEGYTDVMACHLAGFPTAVAACGTAFGSEHISILRRLLMDDDVLAGQVTFTFDGDAAGQKAAMRAFEEDQRFTSRTFAAVDPAGRDPNDIRIAEGDEGIRQLLDARVPMFEFAIKHVLSRFDVSSALGRTDALVAVAPLVANIKDPALRPEYARLLVRWIGLDSSTVQRAINQAGRVSAGQSGKPGKPGPADRGHQEDRGNAAGPGPELAARNGGGTSAGTAGGSVAGPVDAPVASVPMPVHEREAVKVALQTPNIVDEWLTEVDAGAFTHPGLNEVFAAARAAGFTQAANQPGWVDTVLSHVPADRVEVRQLVHALTVEPLVSTEPGYAVGVIARLLEQVTIRQIADVRAELSQASRTNQADLLRQLIELEDYRSALLTTISGNPELSN